MSVQMTRNKHLLNNDNNHESCLTHAANKHVIVKRRKKNVVAKTEFQ